MSNNSNKVLVPEAKEALKRFKMEAANEVGVNLKEGYNGNLTSQQAGSVGGQMVNSMTPTRTRIFTRKSRTKTNHEVSICYTYRLSASIEPEKL